MHYLEKVRSATWQKLALSAVLYAGKSGRRLAPTASLERRLKRAVANAEADAKADCGEEACVGAIPVRAEELLAVWRELANAECTRFLRELARQSANGVHRNQVVAYLDSAKPPLSIEQRQVISWLFLIGEDARMPRRGYRHSMGALHAWHFAVAIEQRYTVPLPHWPATRLSALELAFISEFTTLGIHFYSAPVSLDVLTLYEVRMSSDDL